MKNKLERFVNGHRDAFDSELPERDVWSSIDTTQRSKNKLVSFFTPMRAAASLLVLVNVAVLLFLLQRRPETTADKSAPPVVQQPINGQQASQETIEQISKIVETKQAALKEVASANPVLYRKFTEALSQLSSMYKQLEIEFDKTPNKEALMEAMIQNLGLQQELLNQQLAIYQKVKQQKNEKTDKHI